jgi:fumarylacetoacetate (FAA) hydrolase
MKLATRKDGTRDGELMVVRADGLVYASARAVAPTMQAALDRWSELEPALRGLAAQLDAGALEGEPVDVGALGPVLPRAYEWVDGSAYLNHVRLVRKARGAEPPATLETDPLVYQGGSSVLLGPTQDIPLWEASWGLDFEGEICVVLGDTPQGTTQAEAEGCVRLVTMCNDVTLRNLIPNELAKGFGFFQSKPATAFGPFAVTPDELGGAWRGGRLHLTMRCTLNGQVVGTVATGPEMHFSFHDLIAHLCKTRAYAAGTLLGSGTVSNEDRAAGISCLAERRMIEIIEQGAAQTPFMKVGDVIRIEVLDEQGRSVFGAIEQRVVARS